MPTYIQSGHVSVLLPVPKHIKEAIAAKSAELGITQRELYHKAIEDFIRCHAAFDRRLATQSLKPPKDRRKLRPISYVPLYRGTDAVPLRMWVKKPIIETVTKLSEHYHIRRREFIYTAICNTFHTDQEITECHQNQPP